MDNPNQKTTWIVVIVLILVILAGVMWSTMKDTTSETSNNNNSNQQATTTNNSSSGSQVGLVSGEAATAYSEALETYAQRRVQFSKPQGQEICQATPSSVTFKAGTKFMLDNRMNATARVRFSNNVVYSLPAYSFQIISLVTPTTYNVDCNASLNVVKIEIQK